MAAPVKSSFPPSTHRVLVGLLKIPGHRLWFCVPRRAGKCAEHPAALPGAGPHLCGCSPPHVPDLPVPGQLRHVLPLSRTGCQPQLPGGNSPHSVAHPPVAPLSGYLPGGRGSHISGHLPWGWGKPHKGIRVLRSSANWQAGLVHQLPWRSSWGCCMSGRGKLDPTLLCFP